MNCNATDFGPSTLHIVRLICNTASDHTMCTFCRNVDKEEEVVLPNGIRYMTFELRYVYRYIYKINFDPYSSLNSAYIFAC